MPTKDIVTCVVIEVISAIQLKVCSKKQLFSLREDSSGME
jgi:hypothetical protein